MSFKYTRTNYQGAQVPRLIFKNDNGHRVVLQGMIHIGDKSFYERLLKDFHSFKGEIHLEGVSNKSDSDSAEVLRRLHSLLANVLGVSLQKETINKSILVKEPEKFKNYDLDFVDVQEEINEMIVMIKGMLEEKDMAESLFTNRVFMKALSLSFFLSNANKTRKMPIKMETIIDGRNDYAVSKVLNNPNDVMLVWGAAHLPGMSKILIDNDYDLVDIQWDTIASWINKNKTPSTIRKSIIKRDLKKLTSILETIDKN